MEVGIYIRDYLEDPTRPMHEQIEEAAEVCRRARSLGFSAIYMPQHFIAHPTMWMQPMQMLARLAPDAEGLRLITGILLLTYHNPVDIADQAVTLEKLAELAEQATPFDAATLEGLIGAWVEESGIKMKLVAQPARVALTGRTASPGLYETMELLGRETTLRRLRRGAELARTPAE